MLEEGLLQEATKPPSRQAVAQWCTDALKELDGDLVRNSWLRSGGYSYFPDEDKETNSGVDDLGDLMDESSVMMMITLLSKKDLCVCFTSIGFINLFCAPPSPSAVPRRGRFLGGVLTISTKEAQRIPFPLWLWLLSWG